MALQILLIWVLTGAVGGALVTSILYAKKQRNPLPGVFVGAVAGAIGNLIVLVPLWLSIVRSNEETRSTPTDPVMQEAVLAAVTPSYRADSSPETASEPHHDLAADSACIIVEDDPDLYDTLMVLLEIWSIDPIAFTDGTDAVRWIEDLENDVNVVSVPPVALIDIRLPGVSGPEVAARMRRSPLLNNSAIVLMTAYSLSPQEERDVLATSKADKLIYKPLPEPEELRQILRDVMIKRQKESVL
jgi:CheY-like chemotaxis protein